MGEEVEMVVAAGTEWAAVVAEIATTEVEEIVDLEEAEIEVVEMTIGRNLDVLLSVRRDQEVVLVVEAARRPKMTGEENLHLEDLEAEVHLVAEVIEEGFPAGLPAEVVVSVEEEVVALLAVRVADFLDQ